MNPSLPLQMAWYLQQQQTTADGAVETLLAGFTDGREPDAVLRDWPGGREALLSEPGAFGRAHCSCVDGHQSVVRIEVTATAARGATAASPPLAYIVAVELEDNPQAVTMLAVSPDAGTSVTAEAVLDLDAARRAGLRRGHQVAAVRWFVGSGQVHQLFVEPAWRRQGVAVKLLIAAELLRAGHGWPRLCGGEIRTAMGDGLIEAMPDYWAPRIRPRESVSPPMDVPGSVPAADPADIRLRGRPAGR